MKIAVIGDCHFGAAYNLGKIDPKTQLNTRLLDFSNTFNGIVDKCVKIGVKTVVLTGDIFETRHPTSAQLDAFSRCITRAVSKKLKFIIVVGNHDQQRTISTTTLDVFKSLKLDGVHVYSDMGTYDIVDEDDTAIKLFLMPYRDKRMVGADTNSDAIDVIREKLATLRNDSDADMNIVVGHYMVNSESDVFDIDSMSVNELRLPKDMFYNFDATVMGHVHQHGVISKKRVIIYSGSMEKVNYGEKLHKKVSIVLNTKNIKKVETINNNVRPLHEMVFDYTDANKLYKQNITKKIIEDIDIFCDEYRVKSSIVKLIARVKDNDLYHVNHNEIRSHISSKGVEYLSSVEITSVSSRQLRNKDITEDLAGKKAMGSFISGLIEPDAVKNKLLKYAMKIIDEVDKK